MNSSGAPGQPPVRCIVCQKDIHAAEHRLEVHWRGGHYVVCCPSCAANFKSAPAMYVVEP